MPKHWRGKAKECMAMEAFEVFWGCVFAQQGDMRTGPFSQAKLVYFGPYSLLAYAGWYFSPAWRPGHLDPLSRCTSLSSVLQMSGMFMTSGIRSSHTKPPLARSIFRCEINSFSRTRLIEFQGSGSGSPTTSWDLLERSKIISLSFANDATWQLATMAHTCQVLYLLADSSWLTSTWFLYVLVLRADIILSFRSGLRNLEASVQQKHNQCETIETVELSQFVAAMAQQIFQLLSLAPAPTRSVMPVPSATEFWSKRSATEMELPPYLAPSNPPSAQRPFLAVLQRFGGLWCIRCMKASNSSESLLNASMKIYESMRVEILWTCMKYMLKHR